MAQDANYKALREAAPVETLRVANLVLQRDAARITLRSGLITFLSPVLNRRTTAVFSGDGRLELTPAVPIEREHILKFFGKEVLEDTFDSAVLHFTDGTEQEVRKEASLVALDSKAAGLLGDFRRRMRHDDEHPRSMTQELLSGADTQNLEAELLAELYDPDQAGSFRAFMHGRRLNDLRFAIAPRGALPSLLSPEEVVLLNVDASEEQDGVWYLTHRREEWEKGTASSSEDKRIAVALHYGVDTTIARGGAITARTVIRFAGNRNGARVIPFGLLPSLRVSSVKGEDGRDVPYVQEPLRDDDSFYVILPEPMVQGKTYQIEVEYKGDKVIRNAGEGAFSVGARTSWYPSLNSFQDRATYDLTFRTPRQYTLVSVGKLVKETREGDATLSEWKSDVPLAVAGFNYGLFKRKDLTDPATKYSVAAFATEGTPGYLNEAKSLMSLSPSSMMDRALVDGQNSIRVFEHWFGAAPYGRIALTQQPEFTYGQSWPTLVYLPVSAFLDSTQRWMLMGRDAFKFADFIQEVIPHEVAHQWWGHMVGFASYHDQWLSEGFADFSAGLFLEASAKPEDVARFWQRESEAILQENNFGNSPNDAGPLWLGVRLNTFKTRGAYNRLVYPKGAYVLQMLRGLMWDQKTGDADFSAMIKDYAQTFLHKNASSEDFKAVVEKHMKPALDAEGNGRIDWFYRNWVYSNQLPSYRLEYSLAPAEGGKVQFRGKLTQSGVTEGFVGRVPLYLDFDGQVVRTGLVGIHGNSTASDINLLLPKKPRKVLLDARHDVLATEIVVKEL